MDIGDKLDVKILEFYPHNIIQLNRGLDDGIEISDHAKLVNVEGFAARAMCLKASMNMSYWKIYRVVDKDLVSKDFSYQLVSINQSEADGNIKRNDTREFHDHIKKKESSAKNDLPTQVDLNDAKIFEPKESLSFWEENINHSVMKRELSHFDTEIFVSPYSRQSINNSQTMHYGMKIQNGGKKYSAYGGFDIYKSKMQDAETGTAVLAENTQANIGFEIKYMTPQWSAFTQTNFMKARYGQLRTPKELYLFGLVGFKRHLKENKVWKNVSISYIPLLEKRTMEFRKRSLTETSIENDSSTGLRHGIRFEATVQIAERLTLSELLWVRPYHNLATWGIDFSNNLTQSEMKLSYELFSEFYLDYTYFYLDDSFLRDTSKISRSNSINSLEFRYHF